MRTNKEIQVWASDGRRWFSSFFSDFLLQFFCGSTWAQVTLVWLEPQKITVLAVNAFPFHCFVRCDCSLSPPEADSHRWSTWTRLFCETYPSNKQISFFLSSSFSLVPQLLHDTSNYRQISHIKRIIGSRECKNPEPEITSMGRKKKHPRSVINSWTSV